MRNCRNSEILKKFLSPFLEKKFSLWFHPPSLASFQLDFSCADSCLLGSPPQKNAFFLWGCTSLAVVNAIESCGNRQRSPGPQRSFSFGLLVFAWSSRWILRPRCSADNFGNGGGPRSLAPLACREPFLDAVAEEINVVKEKRQRLQQRISAYVAAASFSKAAKELVSSGHT